MRERFAFAIFVGGIIGSGLGGLTIILAIAGSAATPSMSVVAWWDLIFRVGLWVMVMSIVLAVLGWQLEKRRKP